MRRVPIPPRPNWQSRAAELGFTFHSPSGETYWDESAYYAFTLDQIERDIEGPAGELETLTRHAVDRIVRSDDLMQRLQVPARGRELIRASWRRNDPSFYGRFDFSYDGNGPAKLLEYNADTPTALYEAAAFQWYWLMDQLAAGRLPEGADQYNSIHERLVGRFAELSGLGRLHVASVGDNAEDRGTVDYIAECARQGGFPVAWIAIEDIGLGRDGEFYDLENQKIERLFKLYPWEWLFQEEFAAALTTSTAGFLEPPWRALLSNKGILPILWEMAPNHPNLLPAYFADDPAARKLDGNAVRKPLYSREGANISMMRDGRLVDEETGGYGSEGYVVQALAPLPCMDGNYPVIGAWIVAGQACGMGLREDASPITKNTSRFIPHAIVS